MKSLILFLVLSLFAFSNTASAYAIVNVDPPVEKGIKIKKSKKKRLFKKKSKRVNKHQAKMKESTLFSILGLTFAVSALVQVILIAAFGFSTLTIALFALTLVLAILFLILIFVASAKEKKETNE